MSTQLPTARVYVHTAPAYGEDDLTLPTYQIPLVDPVGCGWNILPPLVPEYQGTC